MRPTTIHTDVGPVRVLVNGAGRLHGNVRCVSCGEGHRGSEFVKVDQKTGKPMHWSCAMASSAWSPTRGGFRCRRLPTEESP